jgi:hypothetical protein
VVLKVVHPQNQANVAIGECSSSKIPGSVSIKRLELWHQRFGHINNATVIWMHTDVVVDGLDLVSHTLLDTPYKGCAFGKNKRRPFPKQSSTP